MAKLSLQQVLELIKLNYQQNQEIADAVKEEERALFHTAALSSTSCQTAANEFIEWVKLFLDRTKHNVFKALFTYPVATVDITEGIFSEVKKVFDAQNSVINYELSTEDLYTDYTDYLTTIGYFQFWKTKGFEAMKNAYNSFLILDLPPMQEPGQRFPTPYFYLLPVSRLITCKASRITGRLEYIIFKDISTDGIIYCFDDLSFRVFVKPDNSEEWVQQSESLHNLGYTPAKPFWTTPARTGAQIQKKGVITNALAKLDKLLFKLISKDHADLGGSYPILVTYRQECNYQDDAGGVCSNGVVVYPMKSGMDPNSPQIMSEGKQCPTCAANRGGFGAGSHIEAPPMATKEDPDMINGVRYVGAEVETLNWIQQDVDWFVSWITYNLIGMADDVVAQAINEKQVMYQVESRQTVFLDIAKQFEENEKFVLETLGFLRYGVMFKGATRSYGDEFFLQTTEQLVEQYDKGKKAGMPEFMLSSQRGRIVETKFKGNRAMLMRARIEMNIEPYQGKTAQELTDMLSKAGFAIDKRLFALKIDFDQYIKRFEREFMNIVSFMAFSNFDTKIDIIREKLLEYVDEVIMSNETNSANDQEQETGGNSGTRPNPRANAGSESPAGKPGSGNDSGE